MVYVFFDFIITRNEITLPFRITETKCSSLARNEAGTQKDLPINGTNAKTEPSNQQRVPVSNGVSKTIVPPTAKPTPTVSAGVAVTGNDILPNIPSFPENGESRPKD